MKKDQSYERYARQIRLQEFGEAGQDKLLQAKVLVVGAGGLGCPVLQYLAAAGVGTIGIIDDDVIALNNLHRQVLFSVNDIGLPKAERAAIILKQLNPAISIIPYNARLTAINAWEIIPSFDLVIDGTDNFPTRYMINDACVLLGKPLVFGAVSRFEGQVAVFNAEQTEHGMPVNYRDLFPDQPGEGEIPDCAEAGVLGVLTGIIGSFMANETIKLITGIGRPLINRLLTYNALNNQSYELALTARKETRSLIPATVEEFKTKNYGQGCLTEPGIEISVSRFDNLLTDKNVAVIDVREPGEIPAVTEFPYLSLPLSELINKTPLITAEIIVVFCQVGKRSLQAAQHLSVAFGDSKKIYSLQGGIVQWKKEHLQKEPV